MVMCTLTVTVGHGKRSETIISSFIPYGRNGGWAGWLLAEWLNGWCKSRGHIIIVNTSLILWPNVMVWNMCVSIACPAVVDGVRREVFTDSISCDVPNRTHRRSYIIYILVRFHLFVDWIRLLLYLQFLYELIMKKLKILNAIRYGSN